MVESRFHLTVVYQPVEGGWVQARITELPGVISAASTKAEATELLHDAFREYVLALDAADESPRDPTMAPNEGDFLEVAVSSLP